MDENSLLIAYIIFKFFYITFKSSGIFLKYYIKKKH